jgi:small glutamine-rich tetratricopeptide repeat-containing protein alpha
MSENQHKHLLWAISGYLPRAGEVCKADAEDVDTIIDTLHATFKVKATEPGILPPGKTLLDVFQKGLEAFGVSEVANPWAETKPVDMVESSPVFQKFLASVQKKGYFKDCEEGSEEYDSRYQKVLNKFKKRLETQKEDDSKKVGEADALKDEGNAALKLGAYENACQKYRQAIEACPSGPNSHVYYCNLAAALSFMDKHEEAAQACVESLACNKKYSKAYSRLGYARASLDQYESAVEAYEKALALEPTSATIQKALASVRSKLPNQAHRTPAPSGGSRTAPEAPGGMPDLSALQGMMAGMAGGENGGMPNLGSIMSNPAFMSMAQNMMQDPNMMAMAQNMMRDPNAMAQAQQMMGGMSGGGNGMPDLSAMASMMGGTAANNDQGTNSDSSPDFKEAN